MDSYLSFDTQYLHAHSAIATVTEIDQQPECWQDTFTQVADNRDKIHTFLSPLLEKKHLKIILTGAGTSAFAGEALAPALQQMTGRNFEAISTTDLVASPQVFLQQGTPTLLVSFARSGNSPESVAAVELAEQLVDDCHHLILTCNPDGQLARKDLNVNSRLCQFMPASTNDKSFAMTSSFTSMMMAALCIFAESQASQDRVLETCKATRDFLDNQMESLKALSDFRFKRLVFLGSGCLQGLAREAALKMLELSAGQVMAAFDSPLGFRHGPKSMVDKDTLIIVFLSNHPYTRQYDIDLLNELRSDNKAGKIVALTSNNKTHGENGHHQSFKVSSASDDIWLSFPYITFAQVLACIKSLFLGITPDNPCPTGEVNRVVQGVTIYPYNQTQKCGE